MEVAGQLQSQVRRSRLGGAVCSARAGVLQGHGRETQRTAPRCWHGPAMSDAGFLCLFCLHYFSVESKCIAWSPFRTYAKLHVTVTARGNEVIINRTHVYHGVQCPSHLVALSGTHILARFLFKNNTSIPSVGSSATTRRDS